MASVLRPDPQQLPYFLTVRAASGEVIERAVRYVNDVLADIFRPLPRAILRMLQRALPFEHSPARKIILGHLRKDRPEVDLSVTQRPEAPRAIHPPRITAIYPLPAVRTKLRVLHMESLDAVVINIDELKVVQLLQQKMTRIEQDVRSRMSVHSGKKTIERHTIVQILARMQLVANIHTGLIEGIQQRPPAPRQFFKRGRNKTLRALRPRIQIRPCQRPRKRHVRAQAQALRCRRREPDRSIAHAVRAFGSPRTCAAAKPSKSVS